MSNEQKRTTQILAISVDGPEDLQKMVDRISLQDGLVGHEVIDRYGLFNPDDPKGRQITHPATFVIDRDGVVRWKMVEVNYKVRPSNGDILRALNALE